jgi:hypothetical protein
MSPNEAMADIFMVAFRALSHNEQNVILSKMLKSQRLREDLIDMAIAEDRSCEKSRSFKSFLAQSKKQRKA